MKHVLRIFIRTKRFFLMFTIFYRLILKFEILCFNNVFTLHLSLSIYFKMPLSKWVSLKIDFSSYCQFIVFTEVLRIIRVSDIKATSMLTISQFSNKNVKYTRTLVIKFDLFIIKKPKNNFI